MKISWRRQTSSLMFAGLALGLALAVPAAHAKSGREIDASVDTVLERFESQVGGARSLLKSAKGVLILPKVIKGGIGIGGEYGEGALRIKGKTADYYNTIGGSIGFQLGGQVKSVYLLYYAGGSAQKFPRG